MNTSAVTTAAKWTARIGAIRKNRRLASVKTSLSVLPPASHEIGSITRESVPIPPSSTARVMRAHLLARLEGRGEAAPLLLYGHVDVATVEEQKWQFPPFE